MNKGVYSAMETGQAVDLAPLSSEGSIPSAPTTELEDLLYKAARCYEVHFGSGGKDRVSCWVGFTREIRERFYAAADTPLEALKAALIANRRLIPNTRK